MLNPISKQLFDHLAKQGYNRIPLVSETFADLDTPLSLYLKLANKPYSYLLESVQGGERFGRYSFIGLPADTHISVRGTQVTIHGPAGDATIHTENPLDFIKDPETAQDVMLDVARVAGVGRLVKRRFDRKIADLVDGGGAAEAEVAFE